MPCWILGHSPSSHLCIQSFSPVFLGESRLSVGSSSPLLQGSCVSGWESVRRLLCLNDWVHHWFASTGRLFHSRGCCDAGRRPLQQWLHAPWLVFFCSSRHGVFKRFSLVVTLVFYLHTRELSLLFLCCMFAGSYVLLVTDFVLPFLHVYITFKKQSSGQRLENLRAAVWECLWPSMLSVNSISAPP